MATEGDWDASNALGWNEMAPIEDGRYFVGNVQRVRLPHGSAREFANALRLWLGIASAGQLALLIGEMEWQRANQPTQ